jgi:hypothetical protein
MRDQTPRRIAGPSITWLLLAGTFALSGLHAQAASPLVLSGAEFQVNTFTTSSQILPRVAIDASGNAVVVWGSFIGSATDPDLAVEGQRYDATRVPDGTQFQVNTSTAATQQSPVLIMTPAGSYLIVWHSLSSTGTDSSSWSIAARWFDPPAMPLGSDFQTNSVTTGPQTFPSVALDENGGFWVVWQSTRSPGNDTSGDSIVGRRYDDMGNSIGGDFQVNTYTTSSQSRPAVASNQAGDFVVVWDSIGSSGTDTSFRSVHGQRFTTDGTPVGGEFQVNTYTTENQRYPRAAVHGDGSFVVVWQSFGSAGSDSAGYSVKMKRFNAAGIPQGDDHQVNTYTTRDHRS